jgi:putative membrane protein
LDSADALNDYINKAVKRYSSLFTLPSYRTLTSCLFIASLLIGIFVALPILPSLHGLLLGLVVGVTVFTLAVLSDFAIYFSGLKSDPVLDLRRCSALSLYSNLLWILFILPGGFSYIFLNDFVLWLRLFLLGLCAILILRLLVFSAISFASSSRVIFYSALQPGLYAVPVVFVSEIRGHTFASSTMFFFASSLVVGVFAVFCFMFFLNRMGAKILGVKSLSVLKVFMANWTEDLNEPLESFLEKLSVERSIKLSVIMFRAEGRVKAVMIVPAFHPGPFKNVGSSALPYLIQKELEDKLKCVVSVPHGVSGHDLDLASQAQNQKIIREISKLVDISNFASTTTLFMRVQKNGAHASCQIFGGCALFTLTLAPQTMEDLPQGLEFFLAEEVRKRGLSMAITIDAHNSIEGSFHVERAISPLKEAAVASLETALRSQKSSLQVGAAKIVPKGFSLKDGMGPGGICAIALKVKDQLIAYVTIDGNNMVSGLRERILQRLNELGFTDGEVLTTDTHVVNGIVLTPRGYHPLGEAIDQEKLIKYIEQAATNAKNDLENAEAAWFAKIAPSVKVIGEKQVEMLCTLAEKAFLCAKRLTLIIFPLLGLIWTALLILF